MKKVSLTAACLLACGLGAAGYVSHRTATAEKPLAIGVITPLSGGVAYWGESTRLGIQLAEDDLAKEGNGVTFHIEDGQLDPKTALNAATKLIDQDHVQAVYSEFNPAAIAVTSLVKGKPIVHLYDAAPTSPLQAGPNVFKSYLDYQAACRSTAQQAKQEGIQRLGVLKGNLEFADLCLAGIRQAYPESSLSIEPYDAAATDLHTEVAKLKEANNPQAIFNVSFQPQSLATLRAMKDLAVKGIFIGLAEIVTPDVAKDYSSMLEGGLLFGLPPVSPEFQNRLATRFPGTSVANYQAAALGYLHGLQLARSLSACKGEAACTEEKLAASPSDPLIDFQGFHDRVASFQPFIQHWHNGAFQNL